MILELVQEVNDKLASGDVFGKCYLLDGTEVRSLMDVHQECRVFVVAAGKFRGLSNIERFDG
jgi:hypothetical protein